MKALFTGLLLALSLSAFSAQPTVECKDFKGNVVDGSIARLRSVMANHKGEKTQVLVTGTIAQIGKEDNSGLQHQKYNMKVDKDITLQIVSNLEFGRIPLVVGKVTTVCGEFLRVGQGMVHWTHFDPHGPHADGFTIVDGVLYGDKETPL
ncbi:DUF3465 domain-containing protein [Bacteriovorax sp. PP10]|uniref:DUF3465 domain-containing protein n=1 Tax=Bacteriovorax antarcticus TaxID=3088717 RepID=A0ABU5VUJ1_9BACT|nr:DUF3465 domain-containing protein [Bacteriovorax sp. PP10]MEA9355685.1 DUF3465 domain-containing protein [Bacteriovorax sp. PP10]